MRKKKLRQRRKGILYKIKSIRNSMLLCFLPIMAGALLAFFFFSFRYTEDNVLNNSTAYTYELVNQVNSNLDSYINNMVNISQMVTQNRDVSEYLFQENLGKEEKADIYDRLVNQFKTVIDSRPDVYSIAVVADNGKQVVNDGTVAVNHYADIKDQEWYRQAAGKKGISLSSSHVQNLIANQYSWVVTLSKGLVNPYSGGKEGMFFIDLRYNIINDMCEEISMGKRGYIFILDSEGRILYHPKQQLIYSNLVKENIKQVLECQGSNFQVKEGDDTKLYTISKSKNTGWTVVGVAYTSELMKNRGTTQIVYGALGAVLLLAVVAVSFMLSNRLVRPVKMLEASMGEVDRGNFPKVDLSAVPENEIGSLSRSYNLMTDEIQQLMKENIEEQRQKRKNEMRALQAQINPHFLYNTLDSIVWMAEWGKTKEVVEMTAALAKLFRQSISNEKEMITIREEVEYVHNYLQIQQMRYKDKLEYQINIAEQVRDKPIIKLVLQPLVENSIYHGIKNVEGKGMIQIKARRDGRTILLQVIDTGPGMDEETLSHIFEKHKVNFKRNGVGVFNVQSRLKLYYGDEYGIIYDSKPGKGTTATVVIPYQESWEAEDADEED